MVILITMIITVIIIIIIAMYIPAMGCPDIAVNEATWFRRTPEGATVGCHDSSERLNLVCNGDVWSGEYENCTATGLSS